MKSITHIVSGGGWIKHQYVIKPRTRMFVMLSVLWLAVTVCASFSFMLHEWSQSFSALDWLCLLLMAPEPVFIGLAIGFALTEKAQTTTETIRNPDHDPRKLY